MQYGKNSARAADTAGLGHITPHQLPGIYATALINAGVSLQAMMALLGHVSTQWSALRTPLDQHRAGRIEATRTWRKVTSRAAHDRTPAADHVSPAPDGRNGDETTARRRLLPASSPQGRAVCQHLDTAPTSHRRRPPRNTCRPTPRRTGSGRRREQRGWSNEAGRDLKLIARLEALIAQSEPAWAKTPYSGSNVSAPNSATSGQHDHLHRRRCTRKDQPVNALPRPTTAGHRRRTPDPTNRTRTLTGLYQNRPTCAQPSKQSPKASNATKNDSASSPSRDPDDEPFPPNCVSIDPD